MNKIKNMLKKTAAALAVAFGLSLPSLADGTTPTITIDTANAQAVSTAITQYLGDIAPFILSILGAALALWFLFYFLGLGKRGANQAKSSR